MNPISGDDGDVSDDILGLGYPEWALRRAEQAEEAEAAVSAPDE